MAPDSEDAKAKKFETVIGKSSVYIYRNEVFGSAITMLLTVNEKFVGRTAPYIYYLLQLEPGIHKFTCSAENKDSVFLSTKPNQTYFIRQEVKVGVWMPRCAIYETPADEGRESVLESELAESAYSEH